VDEQARGTSVRAIEAVENAIASVRRVIEIASTQVGDPVHGPTAEQRIILGERELSILEAEFVVLRKGDVEAAQGLHREWQALRAESGE
jgi:hypothetical protein